MLNQTPVGGIGGTLGDTVGGTTDKTGVSGVAPKVDLSPLLGRLGRVNLKNWNGVGRV